MNRVGRKTREGARGEGREGGRKIGIWMDNLDGGEIVYRLGEVFSFVWSRAGRLSRWVRQDTRLRLEKSGDIAPPGLAVAGVTTTFSVTCLIDGLSLEYHLTRCRRVRCQVLDISSVPPSQ